MLTARSPKRMSVRFCSLVDFRHLFFTQKTVLDRYLSQFQNLGFW